MSRTALIIGLPYTCQRIERQLDLLDERPVTIGWVLAGETPCQTDDLPVLGHVDELEAIVAQRTPGMALISLPAVMSELVKRIRTRLRRLGVADRFMPTLEDQIAGIGPRTHFDVGYSELIGRSPRRVDEAAVRSVVQGRRVLITGAGGTIGGELARIVAGFSPTMLMMMDRSENALFEIDRQVARRYPELARRALLHDVVDAGGCMQICEEYQPQVIFHAAAHKHVPMMEDHPAAAVTNNLFGTKAIADAADAVGAERFVMISTDKAVNPVSVMGATKRLAELYVQHLASQSETAFSMVRFGNVLGSSGSALETWGSQIADGGPLTVTDPRMTRYFMSLQEAAALVIESAALVDRDGEGGDVFLLDMGEPVRILDLAQRFIEMHGLAPVLPDESEPNETGCMRIVFTGARPGEKLHEELVFDAEAMMPTGHRDIRRWMLPRPEGSMIADMVRVLEPGGLPVEGAVVVDLVQRLVPEMARSTAA